MPRFIPRLTGLLSVSAAVSLATATAAAADNDLFSQIRSTAVFHSTTDADDANDNTDNTDNTPAAEPPANQPTVADPPAWQRLLTEAGCQSAAVQNAAATASIVAGKWSFPLQLSLAEDNQRLELVLGLATVSQSTAFPAERLLQLLEENARHAPRQFVYHAVRQRLELQVTLHSRELTSQDLRDQIDGLTRLALQTEARWNLSVQTAAAAGGTAIPGSTPAGSSTPGGGSTPTSVTTATATIRLTDLTGRWSARRSDTEAFALQISTDGTFRLVHVRQGRTAQSTGRCAVAAERLTLTGADGSQLAGSLRLTSASEFQFQPDSAGQASTPGPALLFRKSP